MARKNLRVVSLLLLATASTAGAQVIPRPHPWPMRHHDAARTGQSDVAGPTAGTVAWSYRVPELPSGLATGANGWTVLGPTFNDAWWSGDTFVSVLDGNAGLAARRRVTPYPWGASQGVSSGPAITQGGAVIASTNGDLLKLRWTGEIAWTYPGSPSAANDASPAVLPDGTIRHTQLLVGLVALRADGSLIWRSSGTGQGAVSVNAASEMALGTQRSNEPHGFPALTYYRADGSLKWTKSTTNGGGSTPVFAPGGTLYANIDSSGIHAFDPDGNVLWQDGFGSWSRAPALAKDGTLYVIGGTSLRAYVAATGAVKWTTNLGHAINDGLVIASTGTVYATTGDGWVAGVEPSGVVVLARKVADSLSPHPALDLRGRLIASGRIGFESFVFAIQ